VQGDGPHRPKVTIAGMGFTLVDRRWTEAFDYSGPESLLGHDIVVWDVSESLGRGSNVSFADIERRERELDEHLAAGKPLVILLPSNVTFPLVAPDPLLALDGPRHSAVNLLPVAVGLVSAQGSAFAPPPPGPFADFWKRASRAAEYASYLAADIGEPLLRIKGTARTVAAHVHDGGASVVLLPRLPDPHESLEGPTDEDGEVAEHVELTDALIALLNALRRERPLPGWADRVLLPGEDDLRAERQRAGNAIRRAERRHEQVEGALRALAARKHLIASDGPALEEVVAQALRALGFDVEGGPSGRADLVARLDKKIAVVEVKGLTRSAGERDAAQLGKWVSGFHAENGVRPKGVLIANAWRRRAPDERTQPAFPTQMRHFAKEQRFALITGEQLLRMWLYAEAQPTRRRAVARSLLDCVGVLADEGEWTAQPALRAA